MNALLDDILKCVQDRQRITRKPDIIPITSLADMTNFENLNDNEYSDVVSAKLWIRSDA